MARYQWLLGIMAFGLFLRLSLALFLSEHFLFPDSVEYHQMAMNFLAGHGLMSSPEFPAVRPPLYPFFLALCYSFGLGIIEVRCLQALIGILGIWLQYWLSFKISQKHTMSLVAAFFIAIDPLLIGFGGLILTELFFTQILLGLMYLVYINTKQHSSGQWYFIGIVLGLGCLCRDALLGFVVWLILWIGMQQISYTKKIIRMCCLCLGLFCMLCPWAMRNQYVTGSWVWVTTKGGVNLYEALGPGATGGPNILNMTLPKETDGMSELAKDRYFIWWTIQYMLEHPAHTLSLAIEKLRRFWNVSLNYPALQNHAVNWGIVVFTTLIYLGSLWGIFCAPRRVTLFLLLPVLYFGLLHVFFLGSVRYRMPIMPYLELLASFGFWNIFCKFRKVQA